MDVADALMEELLAAKARLEAQLPIIIRAIVDLSPNVDGSPTSDDVLADIYKQLSDANVDSEHGHFSDNVLCCLYELWIEQDRIPQGEDDE